MTDHKIPVVIAVCTLVLALLALSMLVFIGFTTNVWNIGLMGLYITSLALAVGVLAAAESIRAGTKQYKKLSEKIDANARKLDTIKRVQRKQYNDLSHKLNNISSQQEDLIALVQGSAQHSGTAEPSPESPINGADSSDEYPTKSGPIEPTQPQG